MMTFRFPIFILLTLRNMDYLGPVVELFWERVQQPSATLS